MDRIDAKILEAVQCNNRLTSEELSNLVGLSPTACQRRLTKLRESGVIVGDVSIISPDAVGRSIMLLVKVILAVVNVETVDRFKAAIKRQPEIMSGYYVTGDADFFLVVSAANMSEYENFTRQFFYDKPDIEAFTTLVVMDRVKVGYSLPIVPTDNAHIMR